MSKFELYNILLKDIVSGTRTFEFQLDDAYFAKIDSPEVQKGNVKAKVTVKKQINSYELLFEIDGSILIPCTRCLDEMEQSIRYKETIQVRMGDKYDEIDEVVVIPESEGAINVAWFLYEFIVLNIPVKHVHLPGECNKSMMNKLKKHIAHHKDDEDDGTELDFEDDGDDDFITNEIQTDPRWDGLQNISENN